MINREKIAVAAKLLELVVNHKDTQEVEGHIEMFENCREQGYRICLHTFGGDKVKTIAFSEHRSSDDIVVYHSMDHEEYAFGYSEKFWESSKHFRYNDYEGATEYILDLLNYRAGAEG
ncbi:hypothetical protein [Bacillus phage vB_BceM_Bc431v3]|uniref:Uncharacterized protein n=1 Tax=Bacillus phage vB_BceM_Bc431v3 TaxID=1195072 RepID=M4HNJ7_9CAUD|nr:hypothetical protein K201_gp146 [Bacillus phage vB_BceM_Bc431v3]AFQ96454.1 hypothetical protein [Bacillus phage vB_BceM_Bc431v3]